MICIVRTALFSNCMRNERLLTLSYAAPEGRGGTERERRGGGGGLEACERISVLSALCSNCMRNERHIKVLTLSYAAPVNRCRYAIKFLLAWCIVANCPQFWKYSPRACIYFCQGFLILELCWQVETLSIIG